MLNKKIQEKETPEIPPKTDEILGHILQNHDQHARTRNAIAENHLAATAHGNKLLENNIEGVGRSLDEHKKTNDHLERIAKNIEPKEIGDDMIFHVKGVKGDKGDKGDKHTDEELLELIRPLIPEPVHGHTPSEEEILSLMRPLIPEVKDGETPSDERLLALIQSVMPEPVHGHTPTDAELLRLIKRIMPKPEKIPEFKYPSAAEIIAMLKGKLQYDHLAGTPNLEALRNSSKTVSVVELDDVDLSGLTKNAQGKYQLGSGSGSGGGFNFETPVGAIDGVNAAYTVAHAPKGVFLNGSFYFENDGYTFDLPTLTITMLITPASGSTLRSAY